MFRNHIKIAFRYISKKKVQNFINLVGLICGITFLMIVGAYIWGAYQVNGDLRNKDQQYLLQSAYKKEGIGLELTTIGALPKALKKEYPNLVADYYRMDGLTCIVSNGKDKFEESVNLGDPSLLDMFGFTLHEGNPNTALVDPFSVVLSEDAALKYFGKLQVIGEVLTISNFQGEKHEFLITGVIKQNTENSVIELTPSLHAHIFLPIASQEFFARDIDNWNNIYIPGFIELQPGISAAQLIDPINNLVQKNKDKEFAENYRAQLKPLKSYYLDDNQGAVRKMINILLWIAGFILLMAIINFINFSIAQHINRLKEIGVRKIMGASAKQIALLILTENIVLVCLIGLCCIPIYSVISPLFEQIFLHKLPTITELPWYFFLTLMAITILIGFLAGIYPAMKLANNGILSSVKHQFLRIKTKHIVRHSLLYLQFTVAIIILISTVVISKQIQLFMEGNLGYNKEYLMTVQAPRDWSTTGVRKIETIQQELTELPAVESISLSYETPNNLITQAKVLKNENSNEDINA
ncbi:MAG: ABC transporter permease, partial [Sphingobacterium sp.]